MANLVGHALTQTQKVAPNCVEETGIDKFITLVQPYPDTPSMQMIQIKPKFVQTGM